MRRALYLPIINTPTQTNKLCLSTFILVHFRVFSSTSSSSTPSTFIVSQLSSHLLSVILSLSFRLLLCSTPRHIFSFPISELSTVLQFAQHESHTHAHMGHFHFILYTDHATPPLLLGLVISLFLPFTFSLSLLVLSLFLRFPPPSHVFYDDHDDHDHHTNYFQPLLSLLLSQLFFTVFSVLHFTERANDHHQETQGSSRL